jgi:hypothetical protein
MRPNTRIPLSCVLSCVLLVGGNARASAPAADHAVSVEIDTSKLSASAEATRERLALEVDTALVDAGMHRAPDGRGALRIEVTFVGDSKVNYAYRVDCLVDGRAVPQAHVEDTCQRCVADEVIGKVDAGLPPLLAALREELDRNPASVPSPRVGHEEGKTATQAPGTDDKNARLSPLAGAGIGVSVAGLALGGLGLWLALRDTKYKDLADAEKQSGRDTRSTGITLAAVGGAALIAGVAMLIIGVKRGRSAKQRAAASAMPGRAGGAITFGMRF